MTGTPANIFVTELLATLLMLPLGVSVLRISWLLNCPGRGWKTRYLRIDVLLPTRWTILSSLLRAILLVRRNRCILMLIPLYWAMTFPLQETLLLCVLICIIVSAGMTFPLPSVV